MTGTRIVAILAGIAITFTLENWFSAHWYISIPLGIIGYLVILLVVGQDVFNISSESVAVGSLASTGILSFGCAVSALVGTNK